MLRTLSLGILAIALIAQEKTNWKIQYELPAKVRANYDTLLTVKVSDAKGKPVDGAKVETVISMVEMDHGEFRAAAAAVKAGEYQAQQKFFMVGTWQIEVRVKKGEQTASQKFRYEVKE